MSNEIDRLMDLDPLELSAQDIDAIIAFERKMRVSFESGVKPKKGSSGAPKIEASALLEKLGMVAEPEKIKRRI